ncbi:hypothetical protein WA158_007956 [Blastocystis sp. Blastoise]
MQPSKFISYPHQNNTAYKHKGEEEEGIDLQRRTSSIVDIKLCIHQKSCGPVIGRSGSVIKEIQNNCHVTMQLDDGTEVFPTTYDRPLVIRGSVENIEKAVEVVIPKLSVEFEIAKEPNFDLDIVIPTENVGELIGKSGSGIRSIADETHTRIRVTNDIDAIPQSPCRLVRIAGDAESVKAAKDLIMSHVNGTDLKEYNDQLAIRMLIPHGAVGLVIGKGGAKIKEIADQSQCKIQLSLEKDVVSGLNVRAIDLSGAGDKVREAKATIESIVQEGISSGVVDTEIIVLKLALHSSLIGFIIGRNGDNIREINKETKAHVKILQKENYPNYINERPVILTGKPEWVVKALGMLAKKLLEAPEQLKNTPVMNNQGYNQNGYYNNNYNNHYNNNNYQNNNYQNNKNNNYQNNSNNNNNTNNMPAKQDINYRVLTGSAATGEIKIAVPLESTGKVIGKGGNIIRFVVNDTQTHIQVQKKDEVLPTAKEREMTITGEVANIEKALELIKRFMNSTPDQINSTIAQSNNNNQMMSNNNSMAYSSAFHTYNNTGYYQYANPSSNNFNYGYTQSSYQQIPTSNYSMSSYNNATMNHSMSNYTNNNNNNNTMSGPNASSPTNASNTPSNTTNGSPVNTNTAYTQETKPVDMNVNTSPSTTQQSEATNSMSSYPAIYGGYQQPYMTPSQYSNYTYSQ